MIKADALNSGTKKRSESQSSLKKPSLRSKWADKFSTRKNVTKQEFGKPKRQKNQKESSSFRSKPHQLTQTDAKQYKSHEKESPNSKKEKLKHQNGSSQLMQLKSILEGYKNDIDNKKKNKILAKYSPDKFRSFDKNKNIFQAKNNNHSLDSGRYLSSRKNIKNTLSKKTVRDDGKGATSSFTSRKREGLSNKLYSYETSRSRDNIRSKYKTFKRTIQKRVGKSNGKKGKQMSSVEKIKSRVGKSPKLNNFITDSKRRFRQMNLTNFKYKADTQIPSTGNRSKGSPQATHTGDSWSATRNHAIKKDARSMAHLRSKVGPKKGSSKRGVRRTDLKPKTTESSKVNTDRANRISGNKATVTPSRFISRIKYSSKNGDRTKREKRSYKNFEHSHKKNGRHTSHERSSPTPVKKPSVSKTEKKVVVNKEVIEKEKKAIEKKQPQKQPEKKPNKLSQLVTQVGPGANALLQKFNLKNQEEENQHNGEIQKELEEIEREEEIQAEIHNGKIEEEDIQDSNIVEEEINKGVNTRAKSEIRGNEQLQVGQVQSFDNQAYYMSNLKISLNSDQQTQEARLYREHFYQTVQSLLFLKNIEKIDECSLIEKIVYLPPNQRKKKSLVLDLDETLVHCNETLDQKHDHLICIKFANGDEVEAGINIRPYAREFLKKMSEVFEIIVFTASHSCYANVVLNILDPDNEFITFRLFRDHCLQTKEGIFIKDLRIIANRKQSNIAIVDNATYSFGFQLTNGIPIIPFYDNPEDLELIHLMSFLMDMNQIEDVRQFNDQHFQYGLLSGNCHDYDLLVEKIRGAEEGEENYDDVNTGG